MVLLYDSIITGRTKMDAAKIQSYLNVLKCLSMLLYNTKLYGPGHHVVAAESPGVIAEIEKIMSGKNSLILSVQGNLTFINSEELEVRDGLSKKLIDDLAKLKIGSLDLEPGLTLDELDALMLLLISSGKLSGVEQVKDFLDEHHVKYIIPTFAGYKLVQENEKIVKEGTVVNLDNLPAEAAKNFSSDLQHGIIKDKALAHNPLFLCGVFTDLTRTTHTPEELLKAIWTIGEYLIEEISTAKEVEINRKVLLQLKDHLLALLEQKENKVEWKSTTEKSFVKVIAALQLKRFLVLYKKQKRQIEAVSKKVHSLLQHMPEDSKLYQKTKEELKQIGIPKLDNSLFT